MNIVMLAGYLPQDPELRHTGGNGGQGQALLRFAVKTLRRYRDHNQQWQTVTTFHDCVIWGPRGEAIHAQLHKGMFVAVQGEITKRTYTNKEGQKVTSCDIQVEEVNFAVQGPNDQAPQAPQQQRYDGPPEDDIPF